MICVLTLVAEASNSKSAMIGQDADGTSGFKRSNMFTESILDIENEDYTPTYTKFLCCKSKPPISLTRLGKYDEQIIEDKIVGFDEKLD